MEEVNISKIKYENERRQNAVDIREIKADISRIKKSLDEIENEFKEKLNLHETRITVNEVKLTDVHQAFLEMKEHDSKINQRLNRHFEDELGFQRKVVWLLISIVIGIGGVIIERLIQKAFF